MSVSVVERRQPAIPAEALDSHVERLAEHGEQLAFWLARPGRSPRLWRSAQFALTVDLVRTHLAPIRSRDLLARSYAREHFNFHRDRPAETVGMTLARDATEVAYALRWLEICEERTCAPWLALLDPKSG